MKEEPPTVRTEMDMPLTLQELDAALRATKPSSSPDPDGVSYSSFTYLGCHARALLLEFYNRVWELEQVSDVWKCEGILPILKPGQSLRWN